MRIPHKKTCQQKPRAHNESSAKRNNATSFCGVNRFRDQNMRPCVGRFFVCPSNLKKQQFHDQVHCTSTCCFIVCLPAKWLKAFDVLFIRSGDNFESLTELWSDCLLCLNNFPFETWNSLLIVEGSRADRVSKLKGRFCDNYKATARSVSGSLVIYLHQTMRYAKICSLETPFSSFVWK